MVIGTVEQLHELAVGDAVGDERGDLLVLGRHGWRRHLDERLVDLGPSGHLREVQRVLAERARHLPVHLEEERHLPDEARHGVRIRAE